MPLLSGFGNRCFNDPVTLYSPNVISLRHTLGYIPQAGLRILDRVAAINGIRLSYISYIPEIARTDDVTLHFPDIYVVTLYTF